MSKEEKYLEMNRAFKALISTEDDWLANMANSSAVLFNFLDDLNWAGFYIWRGEELVLGPFQGQSACVRIDKGSGVCGTAFEKRETLLVEDVHQFPGHIACDPASKSEIVVPVIKADKIYAVLDIDSPKPSRFDNIDKKYLEKFVDILAEETDFEALSAAAEDL